MIIEVLKQNGKCVTSPLNGGIRNSTAENQKLCFTWPRIYTAKDISRVDVYKWCRTVQRTDRDLAIVYFEVHSIYSADDNLGALDPVGQQ